MVLEGLTAGFFPGELGPGAGQCPDRDTDLTEGVAFKPSRSSHGLSLSQLVEAIDKKSPMPLGHRAFFH